MHFIAKKNVCGQKPTPGGPLGDEDTKRTGVENLAGGFNSLTLSRQLALCQCSFIATKNDYFALSRRQSIAGCQCCHTRAQGRIQDLGLEGAKASSEGARIEAPQAPRVYGGGVWGGPVPLPENFSFLGLKMRILMCSPAHLECLFLQRIRPDPDLYYAYPL